MGVNGIYGLSGSGMDIESMVKVGMMSKQNEYDKMAQKYTKNEWMKADYIELSNKITTFNSSTLSQYKMSNTMNAKSVESSSAAIKVSANASADLMNHSVDVLSLSSNAYLVGTNSMTRYAINGASSADQSSIKLADVLFQDLTVKANGRVYGNIAPTDMDGTETTRDKAAGTAGSDGISISEAAKFGYTDGTRQVTTSGYWTYNGTTVNLTDSTQLTNFLAYQDSVSDTPYGQWRMYPDSGDINNVTYDASGNPLLHWERAKANGGWKSVDPFDSNTDASEVIKFNNFLRERQSSGSGYQFVTGSEYTVSVPASVKTGVDKDTVAFSFEIYDGTQDEAMAEMSDAEKESYVKAHTISYTYNDLLGDGSTEGVTFNDLVNKINNISGLNIKATYDSVHDRFSFYNTKSGDENGIVIKLGDDASYTTGNSSLATRNFFNNMGLYQSKNGELYGHDGNGNVVAATESDNKALLFNVSSGSSDGTNSFMGENGKIKIDGVTYNDVIDNKLTVGGITYTALSTTTTTDAAGNVTSSNPATVSVSQDVDGIVDKVKSFITDYNKLLASLYEKYDEKPDSNYKPLTQSQKDQMKEEQITKWEEKAKAGLLYHDQTLGKIIMNMRSAVTDTVEGVDGKYNSVFSLGVSTTGIKGQLVLDEDKLRKALSEDSDAVYNVFAKLDSANLDDSAKSGVAQRLGDIFNSATKTIKDRAGSSSDITEDSDLNNLLRNLQTKMSNFKKLMSSFETALYKKYDAMESTLAKLGTQLNYVMGSTGQ